MAGITTTQTFSDGDTVTAAKLNNIVANASIDNDAITTAKIDDNAVTLAKMANASVDTAELVDDAVQNSKLEEMGARTVKANATNATANPTDVAVGGNKLIVGTTNSINAVSFADDLALDNADSTATKIIAAPSLINGKSTVAASNLDELLLYDQDATSVLKKTTAGSIVASLKATDSQSGSAELATSAELISTSGAPTNAVVGAAIGSPMLAKAWISMSYNQVWNNDTGTVTVGSSFNLGTPAHDFDTNQGLITFPFSTNLKSGLTSYCVMISSYFWQTVSSSSEIAYGIVTARSNSSFTVQFKNYVNVNVNPGQVDIVVFAVGS
jgi:hypothetical protein